ncbi:MAG: efflux RND transporter periplasmic adaptor subunit [Phycisphaeraceae bacterium]|nr:efflux RND transporter periplasmic adaptor subunit [Phycisphaeraceae bacterium]
MNTRTVTRLAALLISLAGAAPIVAQPTGDPAGADPAATMDERPLWESQVAIFGGVKADTKPSKDSVMKFSVPTEVRELNATIGKTVKAGDVLVRGRDADVLAAMETQRFQVTNDAEVRAQAALLERAEFRYERGVKTGTLAETELKDLEIEKKTAAIQLEAARIRLETERYKLKYYEGQYERYRLEAPFDGVISEVNVELGQGVNDQAPVVRIVDVDTLYLDAYPGTEETMNRGLKPSSPAWVLMKLPGGPRLVEGRVINVNPVADSVSRTRQVRVEIANPERWPSGTPAMVRFAPPPSGPWDAARPVPGSGRASR